MRSILIITSRNVFSAAGDATLIFKRSKAFYDVAGYKSFILPVNGTALQEDSGYEGVSFIINDKGKPSEIINNIVRSEKPDIVVLSGEKSYVYSKTISRAAVQACYTPVVFIDLHGALEEGIESSYGIKRIYHFVRYIIKTYLFKKVIEKTNGIFVVTDELAKHYLRLINDNIQDGIEVVKIRCGVEKVLESRIRLEHRSRVRAEWGISDDTTVFVYSGYRMAWQKIDKTLELFQYLDQKIDKAFFALFTNVDNVFENEIRRRFPKSNYFISILPVNKVIQYLCACDAGFLIRDNNNTNRVAFPNKFSEYINAGLLLAISESLYEPVKLLKDYNIPYIRIDSEKITDTDFSALDARRTDMVSYHKMCDKLCCEELLYNLQVKRQLERILATCNRIAVDGD